ncbi:MAG TPA: aspartate--tRNA ligase [Actinomycetota bacterium]|nr:aspartate--tRNA ligase [Actinomycetota bacterium]
MRTHWCGELRREHIGQTVSLAGWVHRRRDHGGVIFLDLRDREGLAQVVLHPQEQPEAYAVAEAVRGEYVLGVTGTVRARIAGAENPNLPSGEVEVAADSIEIFAKAQTPPFQIEDRVEVKEEIRLKYRYLDLRRPEMQKALRMRHTVVKAIRDYFDSEGFVEVETPMLNKSTPEGARDYLVPSRLQPGNFFALQQSPQLFKQLLMVAGLDRYYQIVRCFRDEDPRADRQPDFTQLDMEASFADEAAVRQFSERMFVAVMRKALGVEIETPFPQMSYDEAMDVYGSDKPDLRFGLPMVELTKVFAGTGVQMFQRTLDKGGVVKGLRVSGGAGFSRKELEALVNVARTFGAGGMAWISYGPDGPSGPLSKALSEEEVSGVKEVAGALTGDIVLLVCDALRVAQRSLGEVRLALGDKLNLRPDVEPTDPDAWKFLWVIDAPMVEWNPKENRWDPTHHPFTAPHDADVDMIDTDPGAVRSRSYDAVLNGWEVAGGSIRIHDPALQRRVFGLIGIDEEKAERMFGWFVDAYNYGAPPHGGIAAGIDRLVALVAGRSSIREVMAFPKSSAMTDLMTGAPDIVDQALLDDLHIKVVAPPPE